MITLYPVLGCYCIVVVYTVMLYAMLCITVLCFSNLLIMAIEVDSNV